MKVLAGAYQPDAGTIALNGRAVRITNPRHAQKLGVGIIYQEFNLVPHMNVAQNIFQGRFPHRWGFLDHATMHAESRKLLDGLSMDIDTRAKVVNLGVAQQQMVEVAKALSVQSRILIMDEPTAALTDHEIEQLFATIHRLQQQGIGIIYISHRLQEVHQIGDRVTVFRDGRLIGTRQVSQATVDELIAMMVGRTITHMFPRDYQPQGPEALRVEGVVSGTRLRGASLTVHSGEIVGLAGLVGAGRDRVGSCDLRRRSVPTRAGLGVWPTRQGGEPGQDGQAGHGAAAGRPEGPRAGHDPVPQRKHRPGQPTTPVPASFRECEHGA